MNLPRLFVVIVCCLVIVSTSCKKSNNHKTPTATNTISAFINNTAWNPVYTGYGTGVAASYADTRLKIFGFMKNADGNGSTSIDLELYNFTGMGIYVFNKQPNAVPNVGQVLILRNPTTPGQFLAPIEYDTDSPHFSSVKITRFDAVNQIISGTFSFDAVNSINPADVTHVTNGKFDFACPFSSINN